jgi:hypothetical protein
VFSALCARESHAEYATLHCTAASDYVADAAVCERIFNAAADAYVRYYVGVVRRVGKTAEQHAINSALHLFFVERRNIERLLAVSDKTISRDIPAAARRGLLWHVSDVLNNDNDLLAEYIHRFRRCRCVFEERLHPRFLYFWATRCKALALTVTGKPGVAAGARVLIAHFGLKMESSTSMKGDKKGRKELEATGTAEATAALDALETALSNDDDSLDDRARHRLARLHAHAYEVSGRWHYQVGSITLRSVNHYLPCLALLLLPNTHSLFIFSFVSFTFPYQAKRYTKALAAIAAARQLYSDELGDDCVEVAESYQHEAAVHAAKRDYDEAKSLHEKAAEMHSEKFGRKSVKVQRCKAMIAATEKAAALAAVNMSDGDEEWSEDENESSKLAFGGGGDKKKKKASDEETLQSVEESGCACVIL